MEMKKVIIRTKNREVYNKLNLLNFQNEVVVDGVLRKGLGRIERNINRNDKRIEILNVGNKHIIKKLKPIKIDVYFR